jgi:succinyldiaminopimelate transaminase
MRISPTLRGLGTYPFVRLEQAKREVAGRGVGVIDFGTGDPRERTDPAIRQALANSIPELSSYPLAQGLPELREAIAGWCGRRFGADVDASTEVVPTLGSKEAIFSLAQVLVDRDGGRNVVLYTEPGYPVPERGALFAGAAPQSLSLREEAGFLPDLDAVDAETWSRTAILWLNYPNNPTGATAPLAFLALAVELARRHDFVLACDETYSELWFDEPPASALEVGGLENLAVFNTLSKRSSMTGYRSGFVVGDPELIAALNAFRPTVGTAPQEFVQRASIVAWNDEAHVERVRETYARKRVVFLELFERKGIRVAGSRATFYLWLRVPEGETSEAWAERLLDHGVLVAPGSYFGPSGEGFARLSLVPTLDDCVRAAEILESVL